MFRHNTIWIHIYACKSVIWNLYRQEEQAEAEAAAGEYPCHLNAYNRRLRATQSPNCASSGDNLIWESSQCNLTLVKNENTS